MPGFILPSAPIPTTMTCPHGGQVVVAPSPPRVLANGGQVVTIADEVVVLGCAAKPPCTKVQWANLSTRVVANGQPILLQAPPPTPPPVPGNGACLGSGTPGPPQLMVLQTRVTAM